MNDTRPSNSVNYQPNAKIALPSELHESRLAIRRIDWERLKRRCKENPEDLFPFQAIYTMSFGVAGTAGFSWYTAPTAIEHIFISILSVGMIIGVIMIILEWRFGVAKVQTIQEMLKDMEEIESVFDTEPDQLTNTEL